MGELATGLGVGSPDGVNKTSPAVAERVVAELAELGAVSDACDERRFNTEVLIAYSH